MDAMEIVRIAAGEKGISLGNIGLELGKSRQYVNAIITQGNTPKVTTMANMLKVCGYSLCAIPSDCVPDNALVIDGDANGD